MRLEGKTALIAGAATAVQGELMGIGGTSAWLFAREGAKVVLTDVNEGPGRTAAAQIRESGGKAIFVGLDVTSEEAWDLAIQRTISEFGGLDILVNAAVTPPRRCGGCRSGLASDRWRSNIPQPRRSASPGVAASTA